MASNDDEMKGEKEEAMSSQEMIPEAPEFWPDDGFVQTYRVAVGKSTRLGQPGPSGKEALRGPDTALLCFPDMERK